MSVTARQFSVSPSSGVPIFRQIIDQVVAMVAAGVLAPGEMLPSTREMAKHLEVNMMTVSKAYSRLEADGVAERIRGRGMQVSAIPARGSLAQRKADFEQYVQPALNRGRQLGLSDEQILSIVKKLVGEKKK